MFPQPQGVQRGLATLRKRSCPSQEACGLCLSVREVEACEALYGSPARLKRGVRCFGEAKVLYCRKANHFRQGVQCRCTCIQTSTLLALSPLAGCQPKVAQSNIPCVTPWSVGIFDNCCPADSRRLSSRATAGKSITLNTPLVRWQG